jgi:hypothetical protein
MSKLIYFTAKPNTHTKKKKEGYRITEIDELVQVHLSKKKL